MICIEKIEEHCDTIIAVMAEQIEHLETLREMDKQHIARLERDLKTKEEQCCQLTEKLEAISRRASVDDVFHSPHNACHSAGTILCVD